jgi:pantetheine-phosphate adenylyltransferase/dephospho-CoA kinase
MKIVITGGIGSGKSTVTDMLHDIFPSFGVLSVDKVVEKLYDDPAIGDKLIERLGSKDKKTISDIVFRNQQLRLAVESLFSTQIDLAIDKAIELHQDLLIEFPLLVEKTSAERIKDFDIVIAVSADSSIRVDRVIKRNNFSQEKITQIMNAQALDEERESVSNFVITNNGGLEELERQVNEIADTIKIQYAKLKAKKIGIVSGSFDPITLGHQYIIKTALSIVDLVIVSIAHNSTKKYFFSKYDRLMLVKQSLGEILSDEELSRVVIKFIPEDEFTVDFARKFGAKFIIRGLRTAIDLDYENQINLLQKKIAPDIETIYLITPRDLIEISSSLVKSTLSCKQWEKVAAPYVSQSVLKHMKFVVYNKEI